MKTRMCVYIVVVISLMVFNSWDNVLMSQENKKSNSDTLDIADFDLQELLNVEVTVASKRSEELDEAPGSLTVITRSQIRDMNALTLREVLNVYVPGMDVVPTYFRYGDRVNEGIYSRGLLSDFSQQVLILYNGQTKFNETTFGSPFPAVEFTLENIERVEISRTPIPLYGGSAITIINLVTREQSLNGIEGYVDLGFGENAIAGEWNQSRRFTALWGQDLNKWHLGLSVQYYQDNGQPHSDINGTGNYAFALDTLRDGTKGAGSFNFSAKSTDQKFSFQSMYRFNNQDAFLSGQVPSQSTDIYNYEGSQWHGSFQFKPSSHLHFTLGGMISKFVNFVDFDGEPYGGEEYNYDVFLETLYFHDFKFKGNHSLLAGFKLEREGQNNGKIYLWNGSGFDIDTDETLIFAPNEARNVYGVMLEDNWSISDTVKVVAGMRLDYFDGYSDNSETKVSPRLGITVKASKKLTFKALYATAARPPSIYELMGIALAPLKGSSDVKSEFIQTFEFSTVFKSNRLKIKVTPFFQIFEDKIEYIPDFGEEMGWFIATNNGKTEVLGVDLEAWYYFNKQSYISVNASKFKSDDKESGLETNFIPNFYLNGIANWRIGAFNLNFNAYYRNKRQLPPFLEVNTQYASGSHFLSNFSISYNLSKKVTLNLKVENLTDEENYVPLSVDGLFVPIRGRTIHAGFNFILL